MVFIHFLNVDLSVCVQDKSTDWNEIYRVNTMTNSQINSVWQSCCYRLAAAKNDVDLVNDPAEQAAIERLG